MFKLPELTYDYGALEPYIDEQTMHIHHDKHHAGYVDKLNKALEGHDDLLSMSVEDLMRDLDKVPQGARTAVQNNGGGHANHSLFWTVMGPSVKEAPEGELMEAVKSAFGGFEEFKTKFSEAAAGRFGSGWAWLVAGDGGLEVIDTPNQDSPLMQGKTPILGLDVWEHAYYLKYQNKRPDYVSAWWSVVNWDMVEKLFAATKS